MSAADKRRILSGFAFFALVFIPFATAHFLSYVLRAVMLVLAPDLTASLQLSSEQVGLLTSVYFLAFAIAQLPVGLALDRFGPRRVQATLLPMAAIGCFWFAAAHGFTEMILSRALNGFGLAACFMASLKAVSDWLPAQRMPSMNGYLLGVGGLGAVASTVPVQWLAHYAGWRSVFIVIAFALLAAWITIVFGTPEVSHRERKTRYTLRSIADVFADRGFQKVIAIAVLAHATYFSVQTLWLAAWLDQVVHLPSEVTAWYLLIGKVAMVIAMVTVGPIAESLAKRGVATMDVMAFGLCAFLVVQIPLLFSWIAAAPIVAVGFPVFGAFAGLEFAIVAQSVAPSLTGRASTCLNLVLFTLSFALQSTFGLLLDFWPKTSDGSISPLAFQVAFAVVFALQLPGLFRWVSQRFDVLVWIRNLQ